MKGRRMFDTLLPAQAMGARAVLAPRLQQGLRLLHLSELEFAQVLRQAVATNPFLALDPAPGEAGEQEAPWPHDEAGLRDDPGWGWDGRGRVQGAEPFDVLEMVEAPLTLAQHLRQQLQCLRLSARERALALALVDCLDDDGYLRLALPEAAASAALWPRPDAGEGRLALRRVQGLEPRGVAARDLRECLLLQLQDLPAGDAGLARRLVREHLAEVAARDVPWLARRLDAPPGAVREALARVRTLDPRPGWRFGPASPPLRVPDAIVRWQGGRWRVELPADRLAQLRLDEMRACQWSQLSAGEGSPQRAALTSQLQEARFWVRQVRLRHGTVLAVAQAIARRQVRFLRYGPPALRPLVLREIAQDLGLHESTVSRATHGKCLDTPHGIFEMKDFFCRPLATARGGHCAPAAVRSLLRELIAAEDAAAPLSDAALAEALAAQGLPIARRTVTKYRQQLRIAAAGRRHPVTGLRLEPSCPTPDAARPIHHRHVARDPMGRGRTGAQPDAGVAEHAPGGPGDDPDLHGGDLGPGA